MTNIRGDVGDQRLVSTSEGPVVTTPFFFVLPGIPSGFLSVAGRRRFILLLHDTCGDVIFMFEYCAIMFVKYWAVLFFMILIFDGVQLEV